MTDVDELIAAIYRGDLPTLERLLDSESVNARDRDGRTPLMHAVLDSTCRPEIVRFLLSRGAEVDAADSQQHWTALHFAARDQRLEVVGILLDHGAAVDPQDAFGNTPLWRCVIDHRLDMKVAAALLARGADPNLENHHGVSPRGLLVKMGQDELAANLERLAAGRRA